MTLAEMFAAELDREAPATRRALERVPAGHYDWKPHPKSMTFGYLATLVATMPSWINMMVEQDSLDIHPPGGEPYKAEELHTSKELVAAFDRCVAKAKASLAHATDEHLMTKWQFKVGGKVVNEQVRHEAIRDAVMSHLAHHRGQMTVYLRLNQASVPSIYGPSADEGNFG